MWTHGLNKTVHTWNDHICYSQGGKRGNFFHQQVGYRQITAHDHGERSPEDRSLPDPTVTKEPSVSRASLTFSISSNTQSALNLLATQQLGTQTTNLTLWFFELFILSTQKHSVSQLSKTGSTGAFYATPRRGWGAPLNVPHSPSNTFTQIFPSKAPPLTEKERKYPVGTPTVVAGYWAPKLLKIRAETTSPGEIWEGERSCVRACVVFILVIIVAVVLVASQSPSPDSHTRTHQQQEQQQEREDKGE